MSRLDVEALPVLARIVTEFGRVQRSTQDAHGDPESDTTHTVMLALLAISLSDLSPVSLEPALILLFALVHDLPEVYAGDTCTAGGLTPEQQAAKAYRESAALDRLSLELVDPRLRWIPELIERYERQDTPEARFVRVVDKMTPKLTHVLNGGGALRAVGIHDVVQLHQAQERQLAELFEQYGDELEPVLEVLQAVHFLAENAFMESCMRALEDRRWALRVGDDDSGFTLQPLTWTELQRQKDLQAPAVVQWWEIDRAGARVRP